MSCCGDIFGYAKVSTIVELCLSVIVNIGLLLGFIFIAQDLFTTSNQVGDFWQIGLFNLVLITTNTILVIFRA